MLISSCGWYSVAWEEDDAIEFVWFVCSCVMMYYWQTYCLSYLMLLLFWGRWCDINCSCLFHRRDQDIASKSRLSHFKVTICPRTCQCRNRICDISTSSLFVRYEMRLLISPSRQNLRYLCELSCLSWRTSNARPGRALRVCTCT